MARGGKRTGQPGKPYPQRTDLRGPGAPDIPKTPQGQPYGAAKQQQAVQQSGPGSLETGSGPTPGMGQPPVQPRPFNRPSDRPTEPVTAGLRRGPGPGPEALSGFQANPEDVDLAEMAIYLPMLEHMAARPGASMATKVFVRRLRGAIPPNLEI